MHKVLVGVEYNGKRVEPGTVVDDIPAKSVGWLLEQGIIEPAEKPKQKPKSEPVSEDKGDK